MLSLGNRRRSWTSIGSIFCLILFLNQTVTAHTYNVEIYDGFDAAGWTMDGGTITTNGFVGTIDETTDIDSVFTGWSIRFTSPQRQFQFTPGNSEFTAIDIFSGSTTPVVDVDGREINVLFKGVSFVLNSDSGQSILWDPAALFGSYRIYSLVELHDGDSSARAAVNFVCYVNDCPPEWEKDLLVASVPEPATGVLMAMVVCLGIARRRPRARCAAV